MAGRAACDGPSCMGGLEAHERQLIAAKRAEELQRRCSNLRMRWEPMTSEAPYTFGRAFRDPTGVWPAQQQEPANFDVTAVAVTGVN